MDELEQLNQKIVALQGDLAEVMKARDEVLQQNGYHPFPEMSSLTWHVTEPNIGYAVGLYHYLEGDSSVPLYPVLIYPGVQLARADNVIYLYFKTMEAFAQLSPSLDISLVCLKNWIDECDQVIFDKTMERNKVVQYYRVIREAMTGGSNDV